MAITTEERDQIISLFVGMWNAAPGSDDLSELVALFEGGSTILELANSLAQSDYYEVVYPAHLTNSEWATRLLEYVLGDEVSDSSKLGAVAYVTDSLNAGNTRPEMIVAVMTTLLHHFEQDILFDAAEAVRNKVVVANHYAVTLGLQSASLKGLQEVVENVASSADTVETAMERSENIGAYRIDLASLDGGNGFRLDGESQSDNFGISVSEAGDVNGDGYDDLIVGAPRAPYNGSLSGSSYVVFGRADGFTANMKLADLDGINGFRIDGAFNEWSGDPVSGAGDVNGDGYDDLIVGVPSADYNGNNSGSAYVVFGKASSFEATLELASLEEGQGFRLDGAAAWDSFGQAVSGAGDVNGDGIDDLIIGAPLFNEASGTSYVIFGKVGGFDISSDVTSLDGTDGFRLGIDTVGQLGFSVSRAGDINGDGIDDLIVGAPHANESFGTSYVIFGKVGGFDATIELANLDGSNGFRLDGETFLEYSGFSVSGAGDVNGDGVDDLIIGAPLADPNNSGSSYVAFGHSGKFDAVINLANLDGSNGFRLDGERFGDTSGYSVSDAGDFNGDGFDDLIIGAKSADPNGSGPGSSYLVYGKPGGFDAVINLAYLSGSKGFRLDSAATQYYPGASGSSVSSAGDVNGDGFDDLIIGAPGADANGTDSGASYIVFGSSMLLANSKPTGDVSITGSAFVNKTLTAISSLIDGDGLGAITYQWKANELPIEGANADTYTLTADEAGKKISVTASYTDGAGREESVDSDATDPVYSAEATFELSSLDGNNGFRLGGANYEDQSGWSVSGAGDINGDGYDDVIIGAPHIYPYYDTRGSGYVLFGKAGGYSASINAVDLDGSNGFRLQGVVEGDNVGFSVGGAGDVNGDGFDDLIIGAPNADPSGSKSGSSYVVFGKAGDYAASIDLGSLDGSDGFRLDGVAEGSVSGYSVSGAGDVNGDGYEDLIIGAPDAEVTAYPNGSSYVIFGKAGGFAATVNLDELDGSNGYSLTATASGSYGFGASVNGAGDINGDGYDDLIVGAPRSKTSYVLFGKADGYSESVNLSPTSLDGSNGFSLFSESFLSAGTSVAGAGDINGDGYDDLIIGAPYGFGYTESTSGSSYVVFGKQDGFDGRIDLTSLDGSNGFRLDGVVTIDWSMGSSVSDAGDFNGDGFDDLIVGDPHASISGLDAGSSYVVYGNADGFDDIVNLASLDGDNGFRLDGVEGSDQSGTSVSSAGDVNGDGFDDLIIGAINVNPDGIIQAGASYVVFGKSGRVVDRLIQGGPESDYLVGGIGDDTLRGFAGRDTLEGSTGNDVVEGGEDIDVSVFNGNLLDYSVLRTQEVIQVSGSDGVDDLIGVERLQFDDKSLAFDLDGSAGETAKLLGVVLGKDYWYNRDFIGIGLDLLDDSAISFEALVDLAFSAVLGPVPSNEAVVSLIYTNLVGQAPSEGELSTLVADLLDSRAYTQAGLGVLAAENELNLSNIDFVGISSTGLEYYALG